MKQRILQSIFLLSSISPFWAEEQESYGLDVSFPVHHRISTNYDSLPHNQDPKLAVPWQYKDMVVQPLGDREAVYAKHLQSCRDAYAPKGGMCDRFEYDRMLMNLRQPQSMQNYTDVGFQKIRAPPEVVKLAKEFWNKNQLNRREENWGIGNSYMNSWESPTYLVNVEDKKLRGGGMGLRQRIWDAAEETLEEWTSEELSPTSMYGIRVYTNGAILLPHVDRLPLVASAMLNIDQDVDEPWPMEIYDHSGKAHNVTLDPGDMLLFESHSVVHGRPFPLKGRYYAMLFIHFEPTGHSLRHNAAFPEGNLDRQYRQATEDGVGGQSADAGGNLPPYIRRESPEEEHWRMLNPNGWKLPATHKSKTEKKVRVAVTAGDVDLVQIEIDKSEKEVLRERDEKGFQLLHDGVVAGNTDVVELLVDSGADINTRTAGGRGSTPLHLAEKMHGKAHPIVQYLKSLGALSVGPEL